MVETQVVQYEQVGGQEGPEGALHGIVHPGLGHGLEVVVGVDEAEGVPRPDGGVAQGLGQEALADTAGRTSSTRSCLARNSREKAASNSRRSMVMDADQSKSSRRQISAADLLEAGALQAHLDALVGAAVDLVAEDYLQEGGVVQLFPAGKGDALGQSGGWAPPGDA